jgi:lambda repressor-like predicted transcriptional regulator
VKIAAGLKSAWKTMAAENSEAWYIKDAASCTTLEAFVSFAPLCAGPFEEASTLEG